MWTNGSYCACDADGTTSTSQYHTECGACHASCNHCEKADDPNSCRACSANGAETPMAFGTCYCQRGYIPQTSPTANCVSNGGCHGSCGMCTTPASSSSCLSCSAYAAILDNRPSGHCVCNNNYVAETDPVGSCMLCDKSCSECNAETPTSCTKCAIPEATLNTGGNFWGTCSCGSQYVPQPVARTSCVPCHASCKTCVNDQASGCLTCKIAEATLDDPLGGTCACTAPKYKAVTSPTTPCESLCHASCLTCVNPTSGGCLTCKVTEASLTKADGGVCFCGSGFVREYSPTVQCGKCAEYDCVCSGQKGTSCLNLELQAFVAFARTEYNLPMASPTNGAWCFGSPMPISIRQIKDVEAVIGPISRDLSGNLNPTNEECYELLRAQWPFISYWFGLIFPSFSPPAAATTQEIYNTAMGLRVWIFRFGGNNMFTKPAWGPLVAAFNAPGTQWINYLAWTDGYSTDGKTALVYPAELQALLNARDKAIISHFSTVCGTAGCALKTQCGLVAPASACTAP